MEKVIEHPTKWFFLYEGKQIAKRKKIKFINEDTIKSWLDTIPEIVYEYEHEERVAEKLGRRLEGLIKDIQGINGKINGITIAVDKDTGFCAWAICSVKDIFSKKHGRLMTAIALSEYLAMVDEPNWDRRVRVLVENKILAVSKEEVLDKGYKDIRYSGRIY